MLAKLRQQSPPKEHGDRGRGTMHFTGVMHLVHEHHCGQQRPATIVHSMARLVPRVRLTWPMDAEAV